MTQDSKDAIRLFGVTKRYGARKALDNVNLAFSCGEFAFVTGPSGAGKSTLLRLLYLAADFHQGEILVLNRNVKRMARGGLPLLRRKIGVVFQDFKLISSMSVFDNVALVLEVAGKDRRFISKKVSSLLRSMGMEGKANALPQSLSGGEQQKAALARAVCADPEIILADEPTGSLDEDSAAVVMNILLDYHSRGATVLVATHDKGLIASHKKRVVTLVNGAVADDSGGP
jgi:cell division transport system ATP-binding protein